MTHEHVHFMDVVNSLADQVLLIPLPIRAGLDMLAAVTAVGGLLSVLPSVTAAMGLVWYCILIYGKIRSWRKDD